VYWQVWYCVLCARHRSGGAGRIPVPGPGEGRRRKPHVRQRSVVVWRGVLRSTNGTAAVGQVFSVTVFLACAWNCDSQVTLLLRQSTKVRSLGFVDAPLRVQVSEEWIMKRAKKSRGTEEKGESRKGDVCRAGEESGSVGAGAVHKNHPHLEPMQIVGWEGTWGLVIGAVVLPLLYMIHGASFSARGCACSDVDISCLLGCTLPLSSARDA
jgi:hypothetical protein